MENINFRLTNKTLLETLYTTVYKIFKNQRIIHWFLVINFALHTL